MSYDKIGMTIYLVGFVIIFFCLVVREYMRGHEPDFDDCLGLFFISLFWPLLVAVFGVAGSFIVSARFTARKLVGIIENRKRLR